MPKKATPKRGSGAPTEAYYSESLGLGQLKVRLAFELIERAKRMAKEDGVSLAALLTRLLEESWARRRKRLT